VGILKQKNMKLVPLDLDFIVGTDEKSQNEYTAAILHNLNIEAREQLIKDGFPDLADVLYPIGKDKDKDEL
jgi:hypothetical protein